VRVGRGRGRMTRPRRSQLELATVTKGKKDRKEEPGEENETRQHEV
jgi:hypothetical protein